jgi:LmbE family N-acetylglucosaminyl deacetylase
MRLRAEVCKVIRVHKPDLVFCPDPWREYQMHPDHRVAGWAALDGVIAARDHLFFPEQLTNGLVHHRVSRVLLFGTADPNMWFDISSTMKTKIHALEAHESQVSDFKRLAERMHAFAGATGKAWGLEKAEAFRYLELG